MAAPHITHLSCSPALQGIRSWQRNFARSSPSYTGSSTLDLSGMGSSSFFGMYAIVHCGIPTTVGVSRRESARLLPEVKRAPCSASPDIAHGSFPTPERPASPHWQTSLRSSTATEETRAVCWRSALRNTPGLNIAERETASWSVAPPTARSSHASMASFFFTTACSHMGGESGPSHASLHASGTLPPARDDAVFLTSVVRRSCPLSTREMASSAVFTIVTTATAFSASIAMKLSTGISSASAFPSPLPGFNTGFPPVSAAHRRRTGSIWAAMRSRSHPEAATSAVAIVLSCDVIFAELACCTTRSMFGGSPKSDGSSTSGNWLMIDWYSSFFILSGTTTPALSGPSFPRVFGRGCAARFPIPMFSGL
mmetsp:Transcript_19355/g.46760  ORF Transcript_19355/g.46760 Transcript_19355/m.46760 type:complete len:368 (+) Transcript_19355:3-1106(+)